MPFVHDLPITCPNSYIYAATSATGGLGVPDFVDFVPRNRCNRLAKLEKSSVASVREPFCLHGGVEGARRAVECNSRKPNHTHSLHPSVDGSELKNCSEGSDSVVRLRNPKRISNDSPRLGLTQSFRVAGESIAGATVRSRGIPSETLAHIVPGRMKGGWDGTTQSSKG